jgi:nitrogen fixation protein NifU and related proteins
MFSEKLLEHFQHPRNVGELAGARAKIEVSNPVCGDVLQLTADVEAGVVREVRFLCRGCTAAIACGSLLTEMMVGKNVRDLQAVNAQVLAEGIGGLPEASFHAALLAEDGVKALMRVVGS